MQIFKILNYSLSIFILLLCIERGALRGQQLSVLLKKASLITPKLNES
jgi:hypothetical protein